MVEAFADGLPKAFDGSLGGLSQQGLELGEELLDRIEIGTVGRKVEQLGADRLDESAYPRPLVAGEIVHITMSPGLRVGARNCST